MKLIAHRGASVIYQEDTLKALNKGAQIGAYAVECDLRLTKDNRFVFFHDDDLKRLANDERFVKDITYEQMKKALSNVNLELTSLEDLVSEYNGDSYVLFDLSNGDDIKSNAKRYEIDDKFVAMIKSLPFKVILGVHNLKEAEYVVKHFAGEQILAFMEDENKYEEYYNVGVKNIRLWESWLTRVTPSDVKSKCQGADVWIMAGNEKTGNDGDVNSLNYFRKSGADGVLLNDIQMAVDWQKNIK